MVEVELRGGPWDGRRMEVDDDVSVIGFRNVWPPNLTGVGAGVEVLYRRTGTREVGDEGPPAFLYIAPS
ncbi:MAG: hypothetical protein AAGA90_20560 [Actinomycetota bacterium]